MTTLSDNAQFALDTLLQKPVEGVASASVNIMEHSVIERLAGADPGGYKKDPHGVYMNMQYSLGITMLDQYLAENPLSMGDHGYEGGGGSATTGGQAVLDGIAIDSPEAAAEHMERHVLPGRARQIAAVNRADTVQRIINHESQIRQLAGPSILKTAHGAHFPGFRYGQYGYENYFMAYALYPEIVEKLFRLEGDYAFLHNEAMAEAFITAGMPLYCRLDHDMADGSGTLTSLDSLEKLWLPHFERAVAPLARAGFKLLWHSDGNLMGLYPYLVECGVNGFQGFQYEYGMDYRKICSMKARDGADPVIIAGVSVTCTLPFGTPEDVRNEMRFLVENGPPAGLFLSMSSSCAPGTPWENIETFAEGLRYYREGRHHKNRSVF